MHGSLRLALTLCLLAGPISAEVSSNHGGPNGGSVRPGDDTDTCAAGNAGAIRYNTNALWYCNGTGPTWTQFASSSGATVTAAGVSGSVQFRDGSGNLAGNANFTTEQNGNQLNIASGTNVVASINVGDKPTGNRTAYIDLAGDATYSDYGLRIIRGNTGANANSDVLHRGTGLLSFWTQDNAPIRFLTSSTEVLRITSNNRVGIGNASPTYLVDIALNSISGGNYLRVGDDDSAGELLIGDGTAAASSFLPVFYAKPVAPARYTGIISQISSTDDTGSIPATQIISRVGANTALATRPTFSVNNYATPQLTILANGNVGIGTSNPSFPLTIASGAAQYPAALYIQPSTHATSRRAGLVLDDWSVVQDSAGNGTKDFNIYQASGNANRLTISNSGNVGIGNVAPGVARLNVYNDNVANSYAAFINNGPTLTSNLSSSIFGVWHQVGLAGNFGTTAGIYGAINRVSNPLGATGTVANAFGGVNDAYAGSKTVTNAYGSSNAVYVNGTGNITNAFGVRTSVADISTGVVTNGYGLYIDTVDATNPWSIYATDPNAPSYFAGKVGIGGTNGTYKLFVTAATGESAIGGTTNGTVNAVYGLNSSAGGNGVMGQNSASGTAGYLGTGNGYGVLCTSGSCGGSVAWTNYSDIRLKERVATLPESKGLALIEQLRPVTYHWKDKRKDARLGEQVGFIAQEVEKLLPEVVTTDPSSTMKSMSYAELVVPLTKAVQELKAENDNLRQRLERLEAARR